MFPFIERLGGEPEYPAGHRDGDSVSGQATDFPLVAIVHATTAAIATVRDSFAREMPQARLWNLLDDRLAVDADELGAVELTSDS